MAVFDRVFSLLCLFFASQLVKVHALNVRVDCSTLRMGQYLCPDPDVNYAKMLIDPKTQQLHGCTPENKARSKYVVSILISFPGLLGIYIRMKKELD